MPNGRNAGRLFADCENEHGYGSSHLVADLDDNPIDRPMVDGEVVMCHLCKRKFLFDGIELKLIEGEKPIPTHEERRAKAIEIVFGDIFLQEVDAIVNPANIDMLHGGGLAGMIARKAGREVVTSSQEQAPIKTGEAITTIAGKLSFRGIIHAVGPYWGGDGSEAYWKTGTGPSTKDGPEAEEDADQLLYNAYMSAMGEAASHQWRSVAFPAISCGVFKFPVERAAPIAIRSLTDALVKYAGIERVAVCVLDETHYDAFVEALA